MSKEEFLELLKKYGVQENLKNYRTILNQEIIDSATNRPLIEFMKIYKEQSFETKELLILHLQQVIEDSLSIFLGLLDEASNINQKGKFKLYYEEKGEKPHLVNNKEEDDFLTLWYDDEDE